MRIFTEINNKKVESTFDEFKDCVVVSDERLEKERDNIPFFQKR